MCDSSHLAIKRNDFLISQHLGSISIDLYHLEGKRNQLTELIKLSCDCEVICLGGASYFYPNFFLLREPI